MSNSVKSTIGSIGWADLTVENAEQLCEFYREITGWMVSEVELEGYSDYCLSEPNAEKPIAGICHARKGNSDLPPVWLMYVTVADLEKSLDCCLDLDGQVISQTRSVANYGKFSIIQDPAGAMIALFEAVSFQRT